MADGHGIAFESAELIGEAKACLAALLLQRERQNGDASYLRAAARPDATGDNLLRAEFAPPETDSVQLLRAVSPPSNPLQP